MRTGDPTPRGPGTLTALLLDRNAATGEAAVGASARDLTLTVSQALLQDSTGGAVLLAFETMGCDRIRIPLAVQYVDHNVRPDTTPPPDDLVAQILRWLESACARYGLWFSRPGHGISHLVHAERFGRPGEVLVGSDSHTCMAGALGMLGIGLGGLDLALSLAGEPLRLARPSVTRVRLVGTPPPGVGPRDIGLALLARSGPDGHDGAVLEFDGPALEHLDVPARMLIAGLCAQSGAVTSVMPSDDHVRRFLAHHGREDAWEPLHAGTDATYDDETVLDLSGLTPLVARPSSPTDVVPLSETLGIPIAQAYLGSSGSASYAEYADAAAVLRGRTVAPGVRLDVNPPSERIARALDAAGLLDVLRDAGAVLHENGCDEFTRDTQAPPAGRLSIRNVNRNIPGRSGTVGDLVMLASSATVAAAAVTGAVADPRDLADLPTHGLGPVVPLDPTLLVPPAAPEVARNVTLVRGPGVRPLPRFDPLPDELDLPVLLVLGDDVSTESMVPSTPDATRLRTDIDRLSRLAFRTVDPTYPSRADAGSSGHAILAGWNLGHGSSREHAALAPRRLGLRVVLAASYSRIHLRNLANYGVLALQHRGSAAPSDDGGSMLAGRTPTPWSDLPAGPAPDGTRIRVHGLHGLRGDRPSLTATLEHPQRGPCTLQLLVPFDARQVALVQRGGALTPPPGRPVAGPDPIARASAR